MSLHFNDYEEKSEINAFFGLKYKYCYAQVLEPGFEEFENFIFVVTFYFCKKQKFKVNNSCACLHFYIRKV